MTPYCTAILIPASLSLDVISAILAQVEKEKSRVEKEIESINIVKTDVF